ncbi:Oidioi.mRNA.OKI2018_I69.XSR.g14602.t1.cds [Oikopleura dioica]|uniref:Oidioi.mRNA.OKI2018_I69.XSR.g14602.t1.cds n=1 Tax=Oikopleura dioica TaxID=34765 RepID=A0ABN7SEB0_OIKDI|nr:Oidioi.mRNA.OKI2018_I69.XSR.g14602.t1.cds [Oikopleura dioica]
MFRLPRRLYLANRSKIVTRTFSSSSRLLDSSDENEKKLERITAADKKASFRRILSEMECVKKRMAAAFGLSIVSSGVMMGIPAMTGYIIDNAANGTIDASQIISIGAAVFLLQASCNWSRVYLTNTSGNIFIRNLRERVYSKLLHKEIAYFDRNQSGEIVSRLTSDCQVVGLAATSNLNDGFRSILQFLISTGAICYMAPPELIFASIGGIASIILISKTGGKLIRRFTKEQQTWTAQAGRLATERIANIRTVRAFKQEEREVDSYSTMVRNVQAATAKEAKANATLWSMNPFMGNLLLLYILKTTVPYLQSGMVTSGDVTALLLYGTFSGGALAMIGNTYTTISKAAGAGTRLWTILDEATPAIGGSRKLENVHGGISLRNENLSLEIKPGLTTAIVGHSGSGKSTITKLILQFYACQRGNIYLDGVNLHELDYKWLRENVAIVSQEAELFSDTIRANIAYGALGQDVSAESINEACRRANAWEFIDKLENGLDTNIGEGMCLNSF